MCLHKEVFEKVSKARTQKRHEGLLSVVLAGEGVRTTMFRRGVNTLQLLMDHSRLYIRLLTRIRTAITNPICMATNPKSSLRLAHFHKLHHAELKSQSDTSTHCSSYTAVRVQFSTCGQAKAARTDGI